ncbi:MAG: thiamine phosphate synthase [Rickettsiales bacterium]|nr:thiamine phosphate synthase [Rickettsiales bacterium]
MPSLIYMTDGLRYDNTAAFYKSLPQNTMVIIREYDHPEKDQSISNIVTLCRTFRLSFSIAANWQLALRLRAHAVHIPEYMKQQIPFIAQKIRPSMVMTASAHSIKQIHQNNQADCDASLFSPVFTTNSHPGAQPLSRNNLMRVKNAASNHHIYALGGINEANIASLKHRGFSGIAGIGCFHSLNKS